MEERRFTYQYSASRRREIEAIRRRYEPSEGDTLATLRQLDRRAREAGALPALCLGIGGFLLFFAGVCFAAGVLAPQVLAVPCLALGAGLMLPAFPLYRHLQRVRRAELTPKILSLSAALLKK